MGRWHWQGLRDNARDKTRFWFYGRGWFRLADYDRPKTPRRRWTSINIECSVPASSCGWGFEAWEGDSNRDLQVQFSIPWLLMLYVTVEGFFKNYREQRECCLSISGWTIRLTPWGRWGEWRSGDPWWKRGVSLDLKRLVLGRHEGSSVDLEAEEVVIAMPEGNYPATATTSRWTRGHQRWLKRVTDEVWLNIPNGIPFAGKGENSWDCGDDGLYGIGGASIPDAIGRARASVLRRRARHGHASIESVRKALGRDDLDVVYYRTVNEPAIRSIREAERMLEA